MNNYESRFREKYPDCELQQEVISSNFTQFTVILGPIVFDNSGERDLAFKYATEQIESVGLDTLMRIWLSL